ncbi:hypothetical protein FRC07_003118 [Ceratobasidium sp. 392]|nr:hypothetical protein FRC07_003118 [Ceratobasidium sp. 392]
MDRILEGVASLDWMVARGAYSPTRQNTPATAGSWKTAEQTCERRMLIMGSSYASHTTSGWSPLSSTSNDVRDLASAFYERGYTVETMVQDNFSKHDILMNVARFLSSALSGDVCAIVFTGHSTGLGAGTSGIIPPGTPSDIVAAEEWNRTIRSYAKPGVIVISILATCFAGGFAEQEVQIVDFSHVQDMSSLRRLNAPVIVNFSSSRSHERSYESTLGSYDQESHDHFLWALAKTAANTEIQTWEQFLQRLEEAFIFARSLGATTATEEPLDWLYEHPQHPSLTTTALFGQLPEFQW